MMALELEDRARARGAQIYATIEGYASTCDAYHRVQMDPDGEQIVKCMHDAIAKSGRAPEEIGYINYHGTSTQLNDAIESRCTRLAFGTLAERIPGSSTKSMIGHPQGASGSAGVVATALALSRGFLPPTINQTEPDPDCDLDFIPERGPRRLAGRGALQLPRLRIEEQRARPRPCRWMTSPLREPGRPARWRRRSSRRPACASASSIARAFLVTSSAATR